MWQGYPAYKRAIVFVFAAAFVILINLQGMRPFMPLFLGPAGAWTQVWLFSGLWILIFALVHIIRRFSAYMYIGLVYKNAFFEVLRLWRASYVKDCAPVCYTSPVRMNAKRQWWERRNAEKQAV